MQRSVVLASRNRGKLAEMQALLSPQGWTLRLQSEFGDEEAVEDAVSFVENALIKARHAARMSGLPAIADDSGLEVPSLGGAPGVLSARYAGRHGDDAANNRKLLDTLAADPSLSREARFVCAPVFVRHPEDPVPVVAQGLWRGEVLADPRGAGGFGYDPLFLDAETGLSAAEMPAEEKHRLGHRGRAMRELLRQLIEPDGRRND